MESGYSKHPYKAWFFLVPVLVVTMIVSQIVLKIITERRQHMTQVKENGDHRSMYWYKYAKRGLSVSFVI